MKAYLIELNGMPIVENLNALHWVHIAYCWEWIGCLQIGTQLTILRRNRILRCTWRKENFTGKEKAYFSEVDYSHVRKEKQEERIPFICCEHFQQ